MLAFTNKFSPFTGADRRCSRFHNQPLFPDVCGKAENGFLARSNCFVTKSGRNTRSKN
jgi:hypothetical protein